MKKKVLIFANPDSIHTKKWSDGWNFIGYDSIIFGVSNNLNDSEYVLNEKISSSGGNGLKYLKNIFKFRRMLKKVNPSIINAHYLTSYGLVAALVKRKKDIFVIFLPGTDIMKTMDQNFIYLMMAKYIFNKTDIIVSVSDVMTKKVLKYFPYLADKIITQQYGVDIKLLEARKTTNRDIFLSTNRQWKPNSNYPIILEALCDFIDKNIKIIGYDNSEYSQEVLGNFEDFKKCSTGVITYEQNLEYVGKSKIFISLTSSDGIPLSLIEAMYLGTIPIVSDIEPNQELVKDGVNGFLVPIEVEALKNKITEVLLLDEIKIKVIQEYNKKLVLEKFDFEKNFNRLKNEIEEIKYA